MAARSANNRSMTRRAFVRRLPVVTGGLAGGLCAAGSWGCAGTPWVQGSLRPDGIIFPVSALGVEESGFVHAPGMKRPLYVHRDADGEWVAVLASCTHRGCQPESFDGRLVCPCHGSAFSLDGRVLEGPADRPLTHYAVTKEGDALLVHTDGGMR